MPDSSELAGAKSRIAVNPTSVFRTGTAEIAGVAIRSRLAEAEPKRGRGGIAVVKADPRWGRALWQIDMQPHADAANGNISYGQFEEIV
jgi:hypothetical protein